MFPFVVSLSEFSEANEVSVEDGHVAPKDRDGLLRDEDAVGVFRKSIPVTFDSLSCSFLFDCVYSLFVSA